MSKQPTIQELQTQIDQLKDRTSKLEFILSLGVEIISQLSIDINSPHEKVCADYSKLCEEILLANNSTLYMDGNKYPDLVTYYHTEKMKGR